MIAKANIIGVYANYDPTKTTALRNAFVVDMVSRFDKLAKAVKVKVVDEDCFGLEQKINLNATRATFAFPRSADKVNGFMTWLDKQTKEGILQVKEFEQIGTAVDQAWTNRYIEDSYKRGVIRARYELGKAGFEVPSMDETGGVQMSMATPFHMDRVGLLYSRVYGDLKGITSAMDSQISRILSMGMADGDNPRLLAGKMIATMTGKEMEKFAITDKIGRFIPARRRAETLARTEIVRAHHQATIQEYKNWGTEGVIVQGEWMTAGDNRVCDACASLQGKVYSLDEINNMIPYHPNCRCIALPSKVTKKVKESTK